MAPGKLVVPGPRVAEGLHHGLLALVLLGWEEGSGPWGCLRGPQEHQRGTGGGAAGPTLRATPAARPAALLPSRPSGQGTLSGQRQPRPQNQCCCLRHLGLGTQRRTGAGDRTPHLPVPTPGSISSGRVHRGRDRLPAPPRPRGTLPRRPLKTTCTRATMRGSCVATAAPSRVPGHPCRYPQPCAHSRCHTGPGHAALTGRQPCRPPPTGAGGGDPARSPTAVGPGAP